MQMESSGASYINSFEENVQVDHGYLGHVRPNWISAIFEVYLQSVR